MNLSSSFAKGLLLGLATAGVAFFAFEAIRRARALTASGDHQNFRIDGVHEPEIDMAPNPDGGSGHHTLASEVPDVPPMSQRW